MPEIQWFWYGAELVKDVEVSQTVTRIVTVKLSVLGFRIRFVFLVPNLLLGYICHSLGKSVQFCSINVNFGTR